MKLKFVGEFSFVAESPISREIKHPNVFPIYMLKHISKQTLVFYRMDYGMVWYILKYGAYIRRN